MRYSQQGLTLIELMVSLVLGLIIIAAATMLFIAGQKSFALQQGAADIQDNANFALNYITKDVRLANLGNSTASMTSTLSHGGIVFNTTNLPNATYFSSDGTKSEATNNASNVDVGSDQLVIQYLPTQKGGFDCEGNEITSTSDYVIQRYFVRQDTNTTGTETSATALALACDAGRATSAGVVSDFGDSGQILMKRVDYFHVLLVVEDSSGSFRDMTIADYLSSASTNRILGVKLGILVRSSQSVGVDSNIDLTKSFAVLDKTVTLNSTIQNIKTKNLRQVVAQAVAMRNALGDR